jgi:hypothetical protein
MIFFLFSIAFMGVIGLVAIVRCIQLCILTHRETGSFWSFIPDTPATRRWKHITGLLLGSAGCLYCSVFTIYLASVALPLLLQQAFDAEHLVIVGSVILFGLTMGLISTSIVWRELRQRPWK